MLVLMELLLGMFEDLWLFPSNCLHSCRYEKDFERARGDMGVLLQFQRWIGMQGLWPFTVAIMNIYSAEAPGPIQMLGRPVDDRLLEQMMVYWRYL